MPWMFILPSRTAVTNSPAFSWIILNFSVSTLRPSCLEAFLGIAILSFLQERNLALSKTLLITALVPDHTSVSAGVTVRGFFTSPSTMVC